MTTSTIGKKIHEMVTHLQKNSAAPAPAMFKAQVRLDGGTQCSAYVRKFPALLVDEPPDMGGNDAGMNPVELLLTSLGACQGILYSLYAHMTGIKLDSVIVDLKGQLDVRGVFGVDPSVPPGYQTIKFETRITSQEDPATIAEFVRMVEARCPTLDTLKRPVSVTGKVFLNGEALMPL